MVRPIVLMDIDGVLSPYGTLEEIAQVERSRARDGLHVWGDFKEVTVAGLWMCFSPTVMDRIRQLNDRAHIWVLSSWGAAATDLFLPFDLPALPVVIPTGDSGPDWKLMVAKRFAGDAARHHQPIVWFDDDCGTQENAATLAEVNVNTVVFAPPRDYGITPEQLDELDELLQG